MYDVCANSASNLNNIILDTSTTIEFVGCIELDPNIIHQCSSLVASTFRNTRSTSFSQWRIFGRSAATTLDKQPNPIVGFGFVTCRARKTWSIWYAPHRQFIRCRNVSFVWRELLFNQCWHVCFCCFFQLLGLHLPPNMNPASIQLLPPPHPGHLGPPLLPTMPSGMAVGPPSMGPASAGLPPSKLSHKHFFVVSKRYFVQGLMISGCVL